MKLRIKSFIAVLFVLAAVLFLTGCNKGENPYEINNKEDYNVSIKYDANGGLFTTNTSVIVDSYNLSELEINEQGKAEIPLRAPDDSSRGNDAFKVYNNGYFLAGWYAERTENSDGTFSYSDKWNFENGIYPIDANGEYSAEDPVLTLYAAWIPLFEIEFYDVQTGEPIGSVDYDPTLGNDIEVPAWNEETGAIDMFQFPKYAEHTFEKAYYDAEKNKPVDTETVTHPGVVDYDTATAENSVLKLYIDWIDGEWYHIYNVEQLTKNAKLDGYYDIHTDLDFTDEIWPTLFMYGNFTGKIQGNGHKISNVEVIQTNNSKVNAGLFGYLAETAEITDVTFENVTFTVKAGTRVTGTSFGLFAGSISKDAKVSGVNIHGSTLQVDSSCYFGASDYSIGLVCGMGDAAVVDSAEITCAACGDEPEKLTVTADGNAVSVEFAE